MTTRAAAFFAALTIACLAIGFAPSCAHFNSPSEFAACMENPKDGAAAQALLDAALDRDDVAAIDAAIRLAPDVIKCLLKRTAAAKGAGPVEQTRSKRARDYLDSHGLAMAPPAPTMGICPHPVCEAANWNLQKKAGGGDLAARVGAGPSGGPAVDEPPAAPGADDPGVFRVDHRCDGPLGIGPRTGV